MANATTFAAGTNAANPPVIIEAPKIPKAMRNASAQINNFYDENGQLRDPSAPPVEQPPAVVDALGPQQPPAATPEQASLPGMEPPPPVATPPSNEPPEDAATLAHKWRSAEGRLLAANRRAADLEAKLGDALGHIANLESRLAQQPAAYQPGPLPDLTPEEQASLGPEMLSMLDRRAAIMARQMVAPLEQQVRAMATTQQTRAQISAEQAQQNLYAELDAEVPGWDAVNNSQEFKNWLLQEEGLSGVSRQTLLTRAFEANNAQRVVAFFKTFVNNGRVPTARAGMPQGAAAPQVPQTVPLEAFAAPGRGSSANPPTQAAAKSIWTPAEISAFYADVRRGKFNGREAEKAAYEADLMLAQVEGRVRQ
jgi:hypothetical protein